MRYWVFLGTVAILSLAGILMHTSIASATGQTKTCPSREILCQLIDNEDGAVGILDSLTMPKINDPAWTKPVPKTIVRNTTVTYHVEVRGVVRSSMSDFAAQAAQTFADSRGWSRMGVTFRQVPSGGQFTLVLSQASLMTTFSATGCDTTYSCNVGDFVIINDDRWQGATPAWNARGGSLRDYRHMVVNHETGHWLGHGHQYCGGAGQKAPVMQQQSINLQGCTFNPWPLGSELYSPKLGI